MDKFDIIIIIGMLYLTILLVIVYWNNLHIRMCEAKIEILTKKLEEKKII